MLPLKPAADLHSPLSGHYGGEGAGSEGNIKPDEELFQAGLFNFQSLACSSRSFAFATKILIARNQLFNQWVFYNKNPSRRSKLETLPAIAAKFPQAIGVLCHHFHSSSANHFGCASRNLFSRARYILGLSK